MTSTPRRHDEALGRTLARVNLEVVRARARFPRNRSLVLALVEEVGEVAQALLEGRTVREVRSELTQVAAVAVRLLEEGDPAHGARLVDWRMPVNARAESARWSVLEERGADDS